MSDDRPADANPAAADNDPDEVGGAAARVLSYQTPVNKPIEWVTVWKPRNTMEANLAVATLQEQGIHARVDMENAADLGLAYAGVMFSKVQVLAQDAEAARKLLLEIDQQRARRQEARSLKCPRCATPNPKRIMHPLRWAAWAMFALLLVLLALYETIEEFIGFGWILLLIPAILLAFAWGGTPRWHCKSCGHRWHAPEPPEFDQDEDEDEGADEAEPDKSAADV